MDECAEHHVTSAAAELARKKVKEEEKNRAKRKKERWRWVRKRTMRIIYK